MRVGYKILFKDPDGSLISYYNQHTFPGLKGSLNASMCYYKGYANIPKVGCGPMAIFDDDWVAKHFLDYVCECRGFNKEDFVIYKCLYEPSKFNGLWVRYANTKKYTKWIELPVHTVLASIIILKRKIRI